ncbi:MAG: Cytidylate kinase [Syntrophomonadaceae bacterium]|nr:Cytidylate kinase [Bacillota bacterium]
MNKKLVIAIDGPSGSGKSTIARLVAQKLNYTYIDTGAIYRAITYKAMQDGVNFEDEAALVRLANGARIWFRGDRRGSNVYLDGKDVSEKIRTPEVTRNVSYLAALSGVRELMTNLQREMGRNSGVVAEGRDIGTVVFPDADYKFYLDASLEERAQRRYEELVAKGHKVVLGEIADEMHLRNSLDRGRKIAPLKIAQGATIIDTTMMSIKEVVEAVLENVSR